MNTLLLQDTDSVMVRLAVADDMKTQFETATRVAAEISKVFKAPHDLEMEKIVSLLVFCLRKRTLWPEHNCS